MHETLTAHGTTIARHAIPQLCTAADLAIALGGLSAETVRRHLRRGNLPGRKLAGRWVVEREQLLEFLRPDWLVCADCATWVTTAAARRARRGLVVCPPCHDRLRAAGTTRS